MNPKIISLNSTSFFILINIFILNLLTSCSCSVFQRKALGAKEMWKMAEKIEPNIELVFLADKEEEWGRRVLCSHYLPYGCVEGSGKRIKVRLVELLTIRYKTRADACRAAQAIGQWYAYNWLFDDVTNEPVLEDFVVKAFDAKKPDKNSLCD